MTDMLTGSQIADAALTDWRKLAQAFHARYTTTSLSAGAQFVSAVSEAGGALGHHLSVSLHHDHVDLRLVTPDAIHRDDQGGEHVVEWVTQHDVDLARQITALAADHHLTPDPSAVSTVELGLDTPDSTVIAPVWAAVLTGTAASQGHGSPSDEIRDPTGRVPNLWFGDQDAHTEGERSRLHLEVYVAPEEARRRATAAAAAGGRVDDTKAPSFTVITDQDGNHATLCVAHPSEPA